MSLLTIRTNFFLILFIFSIIYVGCELSQNNIFLGVEAFSIELPTRTCLGQASIKRLHAKSKWDFLDDYDDIDDTSVRKVPRDMRYIESNLLRQNRNYVAIREAGGVEVTNDVYARDPETDTFWFIGKVARVSGVELEQAIARQWALIEEHSARLRPLELYPKVGSLEIWSAPGDSELDVAYNRPSIKFIKMKQNVEGADKIKNIMLGFEGELYDDGEEGFRTWRTEDGMPKLPEVKSGADNGDRSL